MTKDEFVSLVANKGGLTKADAGRAVEAFCDGVSEALAKGDQVFVAGEPSVSSYTANDGTARASQELNVREIRLLGPRKDAAQS